MAPHNVKLNFGWGQRLPLVLQSEEAECGLACLAMLGIKQRLQAEDRS